LLDAPNGNRPFDTAVEIYFCNVLPGERADDGKYFIFETNLLGKNGLSELFSYLRSVGYRLKLDSGAKRSLEEITLQDAELARAKKAGLKYKKTPLLKFAVKGLHRKLKSFQIPAVGHMLNVAHAANFSVPGSGKTTITLAAFSELRRKREAQILVVIGPRSSFAPWEGELEACFGSQLPTVRITGDKLERRGAWRQAEGAILVLLNYHVASNDNHQLGEFLSSKRCMLVLDESHYIKNIADKKWSMAVRKIAPFAVKRVILSGTPAPNSLLDLWSQFTFLYPGAMALGTREEFLNRIGQSGSDSIRAIRGTISPLFWRIKKSELSLPRPKITRIVVKLGDIQMSIYTALASKVLSDSQKASKEILKLREWRRARVIRLLQAASNPTLLAKYSYEFKLPPLTATGLPVSELIEKYPNYEVPAKIVQVVALVRKLISKERKVVIWTSFVHNILTLLELLQDAGPQPLYGAIPASPKEDEEINREKIVSRFLLDPLSRVLIANPAACAESISLHSSCHDAIYLDRSFNAAHYLQSKDRIHRVGLKPGDQINYYLMIAADTIDEVVDSRLEEKQRRLVQLLETDLATVSLDSPEDVVSEEGEEEIDFRETLRQIKQFSSL